MALAVVYSRASVGVDAPLISIEVHLARGLPCFHLVGLPEASVRESRERVRSALQNSGFEFPAQRITVNLAPADLPKEGSRFDLAIAIGILAAHGQLESAALNGVELLGELALSGEIRPVNGALPFAFACRSGGRCAIVPSQNAAEAAIISETQVYGAQSLLAVFHHLNGQKSLPREQANLPASTTSYPIDMADIVGQEHAKRALEIAAAGGHNLLLTGPPGTGKTMLASRLTTLLPPLNDAQALESATIHSVLGHTINLSTWKQRPFRQPHHTSSAVALVGGGSLPRPGEISLAHHGVLFLDELPEFERRVLDVLREPLESGKVSVSRVAGQAEFPARFQLIAAMNPSPTGSIDDGRASPEQIVRYLNRVSGLFLDRIDLQVDVPRQPIIAEAQQSDTAKESSAEIRTRVAAARERQLRRADKTNAELSNRDLLEHCGLDPQCRDFLQLALKKLVLSLRAYHRVLKVARTIADLEASRDIQKHHLGEALGYRALDTIIKRLSG